MSRPRVTLISLVIAPLMLLATVLLPAGGAQARVTASPHGGSGTPTHGRLTPGWGAAVQAGRVAAKRGATRKAAALPPDVRRVCAAPKRGYAACMSLVRTNVPGHKGLFRPDQVPPGYGPTDLQSAYNLPTASAGSGETVAIVDAGDDATAEADLGVYRAQYGLPPCTTANGCFEKVNQEGQQGNYPPSAGWELEESLDVNMVSAICPNCHIILVEANSANDSDMYAAENEAVALGAKYVSDSWGQSEYSGEQQDDQQYFNHPGVAITAAGGDYGYLGRGTANWPASSQYVTSVGGTSLTRDSGVPRGWDETVWYGTGSGCSLYETKPAWQTDTGCPNRTTNDVSAVADPSTGVAIYNNGWGVVGGTSVATPIIASVYALAGTPAAGSYPSSYPYGASSALNDITSGANGTCKPAYLCTAGSGYDGPTGLGTPDGVAAFKTGPHGEITGQVTAKATGNPVAGAAVTAAQGYTVTTDAQGDYDLYLPVGSYDLTTNAFGYKTQTLDGVPVASGQTTTENFALTAKKAVTLSGTVSDNSGHKWPLYAKITVPGTPVSAVYTSPYTGQYSISLPGQTSYQLQITPVSAGYVTKDLPVRIGTTSKVQDIKAGTNQSACDAPGYALKSRGAAEQFTGWTGSTPQDGWTATANPGGNGGTWEFGSNPTGESTDPAPPGSDGQYAVADSNASNSGTLDTTLTSPAVNLSGVSAPQISFDTWYRVYGTQPEAAEVDLSLDGGATWTSVWQQTTTGVQGPVDIPIPQAAGQPDVQVRFHYTGTNDWWWSLDNVVIGTAKCAAAPGGLVAGVVTDANTGAALDGATVASAASRAETAVTADSPGAGDGFYELFAAGTGGQQFTATDGRYTPDTAAVTVAGNTVTRQDFALPTAHITASTNSVTAAATLGGSATRKVTFTNDGTAPAHVTLTGQDDGSTPTGSQTGTRMAGPPLQRIKAHLTTGMKPRIRPGTSQRPGIRPQSPDDAPWADITDYPFPVQDNAVAYDDATGTVYSVGGDDYASGNLYSSGYAYDPGTQQWSQIASAPDTLAGAVAAFAGGTLYLIGGYDGSVSSSVYAYDPGTNEWAQAPTSLPQAVFSAGVAVLNGQIYVVGGCVTAGCTPTSQTVQRYDPASNTWTELANYPVTDAYQACAGIDGEVVCAGGVGDGDISDALSSTYLYDPSSNVWVPGTDMPYADWGMAYAGSGGQLQVAAGSGTTTITNQAAQYAPATNTWTALPNANIAEYRGGGACGLYQIGGNSGGSVNSAQLLPRYDACVPAAASWLTESSTGFELAPGQSVTVSSWTRRLWHSPAPTQPAC